MLRDITSLELQDQGFQVIEFETADAALPYIRAHGDELCLIITDVQMPGSLNGLQLADIVRRLCPQVAVLVTSGGPLVDPSKLPSGTRFMAKPWRIAEMTAQVERMVAVGR